jgi:hypothetical protein
VLLHSVEDRLLPPTAGSDLAAQLLREPKRQVVEKLLPVLDDAASPRVACSKGALPSRVAHGHPLTAHVLEAARARVGVIEVGNKLAEDPRLVVVGDPPVAVLHHGGGDDPAPREVVELDAADLSPVDRDRRVVRPSGDLVGDRQHGVEAMVACKVEVATRLVCREGGRPRLDLDERRPRARPPRGDYRAVRPTDFAVRVLEADFRERLHLASWCSEFTE